MEWSKKEWNGMGRSRIECGKEWEGVWEGVGPNGIEWKEWVGMGMSRKE